MAIRIASYETVTVGAEYMTLSRIIWQRFKRPMPGLLELTLSENMLLATLGPYLPVGTTFRLPIPSTTSPQIRQTVRLWD